MEVIFPDAKIVSSSFPFSSRFLLLCHSQRKGKKNLRELNCDVEFLERCKTFMPDVIKLVATELK